jgi:hypothetical protein
LRASLHKGAYEFARQLIPVVATCGETEFDPELFVCEWADVHAWSYVS